MQSYANVLKYVERKLGTARAAPYYYSAIFRIAPHLGLSCFNYGYADLAAEILPVPEGEPFQLELYRQCGLSVGADRLQDACLLEISCGLGGGLNHIVRTFHPRLAIGLDRAGPAVAAARERFGLITLQGDAGDLRLPTSAFDVIVNVEASHVYYGPAFLDEVARVMRPDGRLVLADNRPMAPHEVQRWLNGTLLPHGLKLISFRDITINVVRACELDTPRRERLLARLPRIARAPLRELIGGTSTAAFASFRDRKSTYFVAVIAKCAS